MPREHKVAFVADKYRREDYWSGVGLAQICIALSVPYDQAPLLLLSMQYIVCLYVLSKTEVPKAVSFFLYKQTRNLPNSWYHKSNLLRMRPGPFCCTL